MSSFVIRMPIRQLGDFDHTICPLQRCPLGTSIIVTLLVLIAPFGIGLSLALAMPKAGLDTCQGRRLAGVGQYRFVTSAAGSVQWISRLQRTAL